MRNSLLLALIGICWITLGGASCEDTITISIDTNQKISSTTGNFNGTLNDEDTFGSAITNLGDLEGDGVTDIVIGSPLDDDDGQDKGAVWVLLMDTNGLVDVEYKISQIDGNFTGPLDTDDYFGTAVASLDDINGDGFLDIAVGASGDDDGGSERGAVWILFLLDDGTVISEQKISELEGDFGSAIDDDLANGDEFGSSIANIGDLNNDGITDIAVGARLDDDGGTDRGAVWILFMNIDGTVDSSQKISSTDGNFGGTLDDNDNFGHAITDIGDLNNDGTPDIAVGSPGDDDGGANRGAIWILFLEADGTVKSEQRLSHNSADFDGGLTDGERFGSALANLGDMNGDGEIDIAVGSPLRNDGGTERGATWILFMERNGNIISKQKISGNSGGLGDILNDNDHFGSAIAGLDNLNNEAGRDLIVGIPQDDDGGPNRGATRVLFMNNAEVDNGGSFADFFK